MIMVDNPSFIPRGRHLIAGDWVAGDTTFRSAPARGRSFDVSAGSPALVDRAVCAAEEAFPTYGRADREDREVLDAVRSGDPETAERTARAHILGTDVTRLVSVPAAAE